MSEEPRTNWQAIAEDRAHEVEVLTEALERMVQAGAQLQARLKDAETRLGQYHTDLTSAQADREQAKAVLARVRAHGFNCCDCGDLMAGWAEEALTR